ncbi:hypothetical protein BKA25_001727 [Actinoalloteichus hymeniacidonis]|uniref:DNA binding protein with helix-turn-helix domain n=1 Tax=Actinoalloteichus hymeniacidonis TaxID=340345 RepID=A0AAC9MZY8_9PSEU|nr:DNA binding protein with helix-turn-helix domain [Actinoalloteichus hymeniacidonis]MBB5907411.1 hypothetical protein [Actinoalloteichus hymeniacidonis]
MGLRFETRESDSTWIDAVWTCRSEQLTQMTSVAGPTWGLVFWRQEDRNHAAITGPETHTATAPVPDESTFLGIQFAIGTSLRAVAPAAVVNGGIPLPEVTRRGFSFDGGHWELPGMDDAEALVARLVREAVVIRDPLTTGSDRGSHPVSRRTVERRFRAATGLTQGQVWQIERARSAALLLLTGRPAAQVISQLGYYDEPHLARALRRYVGRTVRQLRAGDDGTIALDPGSVRHVVDQLDDPVGVDGRVPQPQVLPVTIGSAEHALARRQQYRENQ